MSESSNWPGPVPDGGGSEGEALSFSPPPRVAGTRSRRALLFVCVSGAALAFLLAVLARNLIFFYSPSELSALAPGPEEVFRLGGRILPGSVSRADGAHRFRLGDISAGEAGAGGAVLEVVYRGVLPPLFAEGEEVIVEGSLSDAQGAAVPVVTARSLFSRHDETYLPVSRGRADPGR